jgi:uncharacterized membrane protein YjjP (DUF1212 family)
VAEVHRDSREPLGLDEAALQEFLLRLGSALTAAGEAVNEVQDHLQAVATAYGAGEARFVVLPTFLVVALDPRRPATLEPTSQLTGVLRLDQTYRLFNLLDRAVRAEIDPAEGSSQVFDIVTRPSERRPLLTVIGHMILTAGICLILQPTWSDVLLAAGFGLMVGALSLLGDRRLRIQTLLPVVAAFMVSAATFLLANQGWGNANLRTMVAPLITFLPGAALTMSVIELSTAQMVSGASRLVSGALNLVMLAFGIVVAAETFGIGLAGILVDDPRNLIGWWAPWLGVLVFGIGVVVFYSAPRGATLGLFLVLLVAFVGQQLGSGVFGDLIGGFIGALLMTVAARLVEKAKFGPPALVTFLPGFWLLVPGALGLIGMTEYIASGPTIGVQTFLGTLGAMVAIAVGVLCGYLLMDALRPVYRHAVKPALDLLPFQLLQPTHEPILNEPGVERRRGEHDRVDEPGEEE